MAVEVSSLSSAKRRRGTITKWGKEGDVVSKDSRWVEIATDKADSEIPSPTAGTITKLMAEVGATVPVKSCCAPSAGRRGDWRSRPPSRSPVAPLPTPSAMVRPSEATGDATAGSSRAPRSHRRSRGRIAPRESRLVGFVGSSGAPVGSAKSAFGGALASPETRKVARDLGVEPRSSRIGRAWSHQRDDVLAPPLRPPPRAAGPARRDVERSPGACPPLVQQRQRERVQALMNAALQQGQATQVGLRAADPDVGSAHSSCSLRREARRSDRPLLASTPPDRGAHVYSKKVAPRWSPSRMRPPADRPLRDQHKDRYKKEGTASPI